MKIHGLFNKMKEKMKAQKKKKLKPINYFYMLFQTHFTYFNYLI